jgi:hypothetical protein
MDNHKAIVVEAQEGLDFAKSKLNKLTSQVDLFEKVGLNLNVVP